MKIKSLHIGMKVRHQHYGIGTVKSIFERTAEILFPEGLKNLSPEQAGLENAETTAEITSLEMPLAQLIEQIAQKVLDATGFEKPNVSVPQLGTRWGGGTMLLKPQDESLQPKEVPLETFFHKIVMMRDNLRVLEQKINSHKVLADGEKVELQQYITRCYGSMTTFNILFKDKKDQFGG
jgi:hypothetical protein